MTIFPNPSLIGWLTIASAVAWILQFIFLGLMNMVAMSPYGRLSDISYMLAFLLMLPFMLAYFGRFHSSQLVVSLFALLIGIAGVLLINVSQFRLITGRVALEKNMPEVTLGIGIVGLSILMINLLARTSPDFPSGLSWSGIVVGALMGLGIPGALSFSKEIFEMMSGHLDWSTTSPFMYVIVLAGVISQLGYPIWAIWLGRLLLINHS